ncbi:hypothetical protein KVP09_05905 [Alcaligenaceae bacterium CGII-47]|nr:hypothetical protein [Alcaligenaceae bacterium CGII-47]
MRMIPIRFTAGVMLCLGAVWLVGCTTPSRAPAPEVATVPSCQAAPSGETLVGNWLSVSTQKGVVGTLRTLYTLNADGTMVYVEQVKRPGKPSQGLHESGCWRRDGAQLVLQTLFSNSSPVDSSDPIYVNRYEVQQAGAKELIIRGDVGTVRARRMSPGYRLPF